MPKTISELAPAASVSSSAVVAADNASGTATEKVTLGQIAALASVTLRVVATPTALIANANDYQIGTADIFRISANLPVTITGLAAGTSGQIILVVNVGGHAITLAHDSASSLAANRIVVPSASNLVLGANGGSTFMFYDTISSRWRAIT